MDCEKINKKIAKYLSIGLISLIVLVLSSNNAYAAITLTFTCGSPTASAVWPRNTFTSVCDMEAVGLPPGQTFHIGVYTPDYITTKTSGNGSNITYTGPEHRFKANGPKQAGTPANITTGNTATTCTVVQEGITRTSNFLFQVALTYTTYEADYGATVYNQPITGAVYKTSDGSIEATTATSINFTIENKQYITASAPPTVTVLGANAFTPNYDTDSNTFTLNVKANNTWLLQTKLAGNPTSGGNTIPITSNYFRASGSGFSNLAASKTQFAVADTYYNIAQNSAGVYTTGSADNINLSAIGVTTIYNARNTSLFNAGSYTTNTTFYLTSP